MIAAAKGSGDICKHEPRSGKEDLRFGMFIYLNMATFEQREWGDPQASPQLFNPDHLDTDQRARAARSAGMTYGCLTTKHHAHERQADWCDAI